MTTSNVTTKVCVESINAQFPAQFTALSRNRDVHVNHWKRMHKSGREGEPIIRTFHADRLPILAKVVENPDQTLVVTFYPMWEWNLSQYNMDPDFNEDHFHNQDYLQLVSQHIQPDLFVYTVTESAEGIHIAIAPSEYFQREGAMWDGEMQNIMGQLNLPFDLHELSEGFFEISPEPNSGEDAIKMMAGAGFRVDNRFIQFMMPQEA